MAITFPSWIIEGAGWNQDVAYLLDRELRFVDCNPAWDKFAAENGGHGMTRPEVSGRLILDFIPDVLRAFYVHKYWQAERSNGPTEFDYNCSSPEKIRLFRMKMIPQEEGLLIVNHLRLEEECNVTSPLNPEEREMYVARDGFTTMCANCRKTKRRNDDATWIWIPEFLSDHSLTVSHGMCPRCFVLFYA